MYRRPTKKRRSLRVNKVTCEELVTSVYHPVHRGPVTFRKVGLPGLKSFIVGDRGGVDGGMKRGAGKKEREGR